MIEGQDDDVIRRKGVPEARKRRSILISIDDEHFSGGDLQFLKLLADLRARYPRWTIRGMAHNDDFTFIPSKPKAQDQQNVSSQVEAFVSSLDRLDSFEPVAAADDGRFPADDMLSISSSSGDSCHSMGNVVGHPPRRVKKGLRVKVVAPPCEGRSGTVGNVRNMGSFQVRLDEGRSWWFGSNDVIVLPSLRSADESATTTNTIEENRKLASQILHLEGILLKILPAVGFVHLQFTESEQEIVKQLKQRLPPET